MSLYSDSRNKYRTQNFSTKIKLPNQSDLLDNHIIITPTSLTNLNGGSKEIKIPRFCKNREEVRSAEKPQRNKLNSKNGYAVIMS